MNVKEREVAGRGRAPCCAFGIRKSSVELYSGDRYISYLQCTFPARAPRVSSARARKLFLASPTSELATSQTNDSGLMCSLSGLSPADRRPCSPRAPNVRPPVVSFYSCFFPIRFALIYRICFGPRQMML